MFPSIQAPSVQLQNDIESPARSYIDTVSSINFNQREETIQSQMPTPVQQAIQKRQKPKK